jgi:hypothetical protein
MGRKSLKDIVEAYSLKETCPKIEVPGTLNWGFYITPGEEL